MKPEVLTSITAAKGVPFDGKGATPRELSEQANWFTAGKGARDGKVRWNLPKGNRSPKAAPWTGAEMAMACKNLGDRYFQAIRFEYAMDESAFYPLLKYLTWFAMRERDRNRWPMTVRSADGSELDYLSRLVAMHLLEVRQPYRFITDAKSPAMCQVIMGVEAHIWRRKLQPIYETVGDEYRRWLDVASGHMRKWLREKD